MRLPEQIPSQKESTQPVKKTEQLYPDPFKAGQST